MKKVIKNPQLLLFIVIIFIILAGIIIIFNRYQELANTYTATFTIVLALATTFLAYFTWKSVKSGEDREKRRSEEALARENRDRKERLLKEIIVWSSNIEESATMRRKRERDELWDARQKYLSSKAIFVYINQLILSCFPDLLNKFKEVVDQLDITLKATEYALSVSSPGGQPETETLVQEEKCLREKVSALISDIGQLKTKGIT